MENSAVGTGLEKVSFHSNPKKMQCKECSNCCTIAKAFDCVDHNKLENSSRDGNTRLPDLPSEKPVGR